MDLRQYKRFQQYVTQMTGTPFQQYVTQMARTHRGVRRLARGTSLLLRARMSDALRRKWAMQVFRSHRRVSFYLYMTYQIRNHNHANPTWSAPKTERFGPLDPDFEKNIPSHASEDLIRVHTSYAEDIEVKIVEWRSEITNQGRLLSNVLPVNHIGLQAYNPLKYQFLRFANGISNISYLHRADDESCVVAALYEHLSNPPTQDPIKFIPDKNYGIVGEYNKKYKDRDPPKARVTKITIKQLLDKIRDNTDPFASLNEDGYSIECIKEFCHVFEMDMVVLGKNDQVIDRISGYNKRRSPLAFYAFNGHMYLLSDKKSVACAIAVGREANLTTPYENRQLTMEAPTPRTDGVFKIRKPCFDNKNVTKYNLMNFEGGVHMFEEIFDLRPYILELMYEHDVEPRIDKSQACGITSFSFHNTNGEQVRVVADPHPGEKINHETLRKVCDDNGIQYSPDNSMGKIVVDLLQWVAKARKKLSAADKAAIIQRQEGLCPCCGTSLEDENVEFDHILPLADGGLDCVDNLQALTKECHRQKTNNEVARGYLKKDQYASTFNGYVHDMLMKDKDNLFFTVQRVEERRLYDGAEVSLINHPYWADDTFATVHMDENGSLTNIRVEEDSLMRGQDSSGDVFTSVPANCRSDKANFHQMLLVPSSIWESPKAPRGIKLHVHGFTDEDGEEDVDALQQSLYRRKVDINGCRRNLVWYSEYEWPVFGIMDEIQEFDGTVECGLYAVAFHPDHPPMVGPFDRSPHNGWYTQPMIEYGLQHNYIAKAHIQKQIKPSKKLPPDFFRKHIELLEKAFDGHPEKKQAVLSFIGLMARRSSERRFTQLSKNAAEVTNKFFNNDSGFDCHVSEFGRLGEFDPYAKEDLRRVIYQAEYVMKTEDGNTAYPIYKQILEMESIELDRLRRYMEIDCNGFAISYATDAVEYYMPHTDANGQAYSVVNPFDDELDDDDVDNRVNLPEYFWAPDVPKYKWEIPKRLRCQHRKRPAISHTFPPALVWTQPIEDNKDTALNNDWTKVAEALLQWPSGNIDGPPGTGKTSLTRKLISMVQEEYGKDSFLAMASMHVACNNMGKGPQYVTVEAFKRDLQRAREFGGHKLKAFNKKMSKIRYIFVDEISMVHSWYYAIFSDIRRSYPGIRFFLIGDFHQLPPVLDDFEGDYKGSSALHHICSGHRFQLKICRRSDAELFNLYMNVIRGKRIDTSEFSGNDLTKLHIAFSNATRKRVNEQCMQHFQTGETKHVKQCPGNDFGQDMTLFVGMPLICNKTKKDGQNVIFANSTVYTVQELHDTKAVIQEVDLPSEEDPAVEYTELAARFCPGYCLTIHKSQGKTFREKYTIHDWDHPHMSNKAKYVALSRATTIKDIQITSRKRPRDGIVAEAGNLPSGRIPESFPEEEFSEDDWEF